MDGLSHWGVFRLESVECSDWSMGCVLIGEWGVF